MSDFPNQVQTYEAIAVAGDFASGNPYFSVLAGGERLVAGSALYVGRFAWVDSTNTIANSTGSGPVAGFLYRAQQGLITTFLAGSSMQVLSGQQMALASGGDFFVKNDGTLIATKGMTAYAKYSDGTIAFAAAGAPPNAAVVTGSIAAGAASTTASIADNVMTVTVLGSGNVRVGGLLAGTGVQAGTTVVSQLTGTTGGVGTYRVSIPQTVASTTITESYGVMTVSAVSSGVLGVGDVLSGPGGSSDPVATGTVLTAFLTGTGGTGTYVVSLTQTSTSATITASGYIATKWVCMDPGRGVGDIVRISDHLLG